MNKVILSGNLTRDPEVRYTQSGMAYAKFGLAVTRPFSSKNNDGQPTTDFFNLTSWGKTAEFCGRYLKKGSRVLVEGRIQNDNYEDKNGVKHYSVNINVDTIEFAGGKREDSGENSGNGGGNYGNSNGGGNYENNSGSSYTNDIDDVDVPF
jgi:single-strand DNA-binding protein